MLVKPTIQILHLSTSYVHAHIHTYAHRYKSTHIHTVCTPRVTALESMSIWGVIVTLLNREIVSLVLAIMYIDVVEAHNYVLK